MTNIKRLLTRRKKPQPQQQVTFQWPPQQATVPTQMHYGASPYPPSDTTGQSSETDYVQVNQMNPAIAARQARAQAFGTEPWSDDPQYRKKEQERFTEEYDQLKEEEARFQKEYDTSVSPKSIKELRDMIRDKYRLDLSVWSQRDVLEDERELIERDYKLADNYLEKICNIVENWNESYFDTEEEWQVARMIQDGIKKNERNHTFWSSQPPWEREEGYNEY